jgi:hypothetical protein
MIEQRKEGMSSSNASVTRDQFVAAPDQVSSELDGDAVILNLNSGVYFGLDPVGARVWELLQQPRTIDEIRGAMLHEFDVDPDQCHRDLVELLEQMRTKGLVNVA